MRSARHWIITTLCSVLAWGLVSCSNGGKPEAVDPRASVYEPTPPHPQEVGEHLVGPIVYTVDARSKDLWMYFDFSRGAVVAVQDPKSDAWDLAFQRYVIRTNGGDTNPAGRAALLSVAGDFATVTRVPEHAAFTSDIRAKNRLYSANPVIEKWYTYSYLANVLAPKRVVYVVRTQDGKYAKMRILSYYCKESASGCLTFEYVYQGDGSTNLAAPLQQVSQHPPQRVGMDHIFGGQLALAEVKVDPFAQVERPFRELGVGLPLLRQARDEGAGFEVNVQEGFQKGIKLQMGWAINGPEAVTLTESGRHKHSPVSAGIRPARIRRTPAGVYAQRAWRQCAAHVCGGESRPRQVLALPSPGLSPAFPPIGGDSRIVLEGIAHFQGTLRWDQFWEHREGVKPARREQFLAHLTQPDPHRPREVFPLPACRVQAPLQAFSDFYNIAAASTSWAGEAAQRG
jgi:HmuY protein